MSRVNTYIVLLLLSFAMCCFNDNYDKSKVEHLLSDSEMANIIIIRQINTDLVSMMESLATYKILELNFDNTTQINYLTSTTRINGTPIGIYKDIIVENKFYDAQFDLITRNKSLVFIKSELINLQPNQRIERILDNRLLKVGNSDYIALLYSRNRENLDSLNLLLVNIDKLGTSTISLTFDDHIDMHRTSAIKYFDQDKPFRICNKENKLLISCCIARRNGSVVKLYVYEALYNPNEANNTTIKFTKVPIDDALINTNLLSEFNINAYIDNLFIPIFPVVSEKETIMVVHEVGEIVKINNEYIRSNTLKINNWKDDSKLSYIFKSRNNTIMLRDNYSRIWKLEDGQWVYIKKANSHISKIISVMSRLHFRISFLVFSPLLDN